MAREEEEEAYKQRTHHLQEELCKLWDVSGKKKKKQGKLRKETEDQRRELKETFEIKSELQSPNINWEEEVPYSLVKCQISVKLLLTITRSTS